MTSRSADSCAGAPAGFITVHQQHGFVEVIGSEVPPAARRGCNPSGRRTHGDPSLVDLDAVKETLHDNDGSAMGRGPVEIEEHQRLSEP